MAPVTVKFPGEFKDLGYELISLKAFAALHRQSQDPLQHHRTAEVFRGT